MSSFDRPLMLDEDRLGWFKILIPDIESVFGCLFAATPVDIKLLRFMYGKLDPDASAFDTKLAIPMYAINHVVIAHTDNAKRTNPQQIPIGLVSLTLLSMEQEDRCYLAVNTVTGFIPVKADSGIVDQLLKASASSSLVIPTIHESAKILNIPGSSKNE